jgi:hypothetical protein
VVDLLLPKSDHALRFTATRPQTINGTAYHPRIFVVDDNPGEIGVLIEAFAVIDGAAAVEICTSGHVAMAELCGLGSTPGGVLPDLVVLDIRMPLISGPDLLCGIRSQQELKALCVVMVTGAANPSERERCTRLGALAVIEKPFDFDGYLGLARRLVGIARASGSPATPAGDGESAGQPTTTP